MKKAFTIVELLIVVVVIGILASITITSFSSVTSRANSASLQADLVNSKKQILMYQVQNGYYPTLINDCPNPAAANICLKSSNGATYTYVVNNSATPSTFSLNETLGNTVYSVTDSTTPAAGPAYSVVSSGLVMNLDAGNTNSYSGSGAIWNDLSGNLYNATLYNSPAYSSLNSGYFSFNAVNNYAAIPESSALNAQAPSVEVWVKTNSLNQNGFWFEKGNVNTQYSLFQENTLIQWRQYFSNLAATSTLSTSSSYLNTSSWAQIVGTFNSGSRKLYVNGSLVNSDAQTGTIATNANGESIGVYGGYNGTRGYYYNGSLSVVHIYSRELSAAEVAQNFNALRSRYGI